MSMNNTPTLAFDDNSTMRDVIIAYAEQSINHEKEKAPISLWLLNYCKAIFKELDKSFSDTATTFKTEMIAEEEFLLSYKKDDTNFIKSNRTLKGQNVLANSYRVLLKALDNQVNILAYDSISALKTALKTTGDSDEKLLQEIKKEKELSLKAIELLTAKLGDEFDEESDEGKELIEEKKKELEEQSIKKLKEREKNSSLIMTKKQARTALEKLNNEERKTIVTDIMGDLLAIDHWQLEANKLAELLRSLHTSKSKELLGNDKEATKQIDESLASYTAKMNDKLSDSITKLKNIQAN